ncbi:hypothetical protein BCR39DRAFT_521152 [Naematelia encephala]|uniref:Uncharacterized protein n=1 Tax=Naematelia encephala TaxID=71784 RepID=A0A1Y2BE30_9TREE|nr:hypothetical protein BCR39DRAFT_521152 [Naematelia encephala]
MRPSSLGLILPSLFVLLFLKVSALPSPLTTTTDDVTLDNTVLATTIAGLSASISQGTYVIRSTVTNKFMSFHYNNVTWEYDLFVNDTVPYSWTIGQVNFDDDDGFVNGQGTVVASANKRTIEGGIDQCVYAQWNTPAQADINVATKTCALSIPRAKTLWLLVPSATKPCSSSVPDGASTCRGVFSIVACDHLLDAPARAIDASAPPELVTEEGTRWGSGMVLWKNQDQADSLWEVWQAPS